jgi:hypothetical protein
VSSQIELRIKLGRLQERLTQMAAIARALEENARAAAAIIQSALDQIDSTRTEPLPVTREIILEVLRAAGNGAAALARADIIAAAHRDYGVQLAPNSVTTTLLRMQRAGLVWRDGVYWSLS